MEMHLDASELVYFLRTRNLSHRIASKEKWKSDQLTPYQRDDHRVGEQRVRHLSRTSNLDDRSCSCCLWVVHSLGSSQADRGTLVSCCEDRSYVVSCCCVGQVLESEGERCVLCWPKKPIDLEGKSFEPSIQVRVSLYLKSSTQRTKRSSTFITTHCSYVPVKENLSRWYNNTHGIVLNTYGETISSLKLSKTADGGQCAA